MKGEQWLHSDVLTAVTTNCIDAKDMFEVIRKCCYYIVSPAESTDRFIFHMLNIYLVHNYTNVPAFIHVVILKCKMSDQVYE